jgi:hypothetical protein
MQEEEKLTNELDINQDNQCQVSKGYHLEWPRCLWDRGRYSRANTVRYGLGIERRVAFTLDVNQIFSRGTPLFLIA